MPKKHGASANIPTPTTKAESRVLTSELANSQLYKTLLEEWDEKLKPWTDSISASQRLSREDFDICINARD
jgi:hypothetical protein